MRIALDAMGTDSAPLSEVEGAIQALEKSDPELEKEEHKYLQARVQTFWETAGDIS